jgi:23S rRNA (cytidine1920-2'-O)/16S rRNA (cytidine1409-2'-O)-methyltransferase
MSAKLSKKRLDSLLVERGLADSLPKAEAMILAGEVTVDGTRADKAGTQLTQSARIDVHRRAGKYVSRGGIKLEGALDDFRVDPHGSICVDIGASTGGFTDCLLQNGAARVYAVDVNTDQLAWKLRQDPRVVRVERNARDLSSGDVPEAVTVLTVDVSFISVAKVLPAAAAVACPGSDLLVLIKPQFELPREDVASGGIVTDPALHDKAVSAARAAALGCKLHVCGVRACRITGADGNQEFFLHARKSASVE